jgi:hypothetical protein
MRVYVQASCRLWFVDAAHGVPSLPPGQYARFLLAGEPWHGRVFGMERPGALRYDLQRGLELDDIPRRWIAVGG